MSVVDAEVYRNPLNRMASDGALRVLKRLAVEAADPDLARLVKQVEQHLESKREENSDGA